MAALAATLIPADLRVDASRLTLEQVLGTGGFSKVYSARMNLGSHGTKRVAFKQLHEGVKALGADLLAAELNMQVELGNLSRS